MSVYPNGLKNPPIVSSPYGWRTHPITGVRTFHYGTDSYGHPDGYNHAPEAGTVIFAQYNGGAGNEVRIKGSTRIWRIKHHRSFSVKVGQRVALGQKTGPTGTTGASTGVHCHTECWDLANTRSEDAFARIKATLAPIATPIPIVTIDRKKKMDILLSTDKKGIVIKTVEDGKTWYTAINPYGVQKIRTGYTEKIAPYTKLYGAAVSGTLTTVKDAITERLEAINRILYVEGDLWLSITAAEATEYSAIIATLRGQDTYTPKFFSTARINLLKRTVPEAV